MRKLGVSRWLEFQRERWSCSECGTRFWWYGRVCTTCGATLRNCEAEEAEAGR
jgi:hypothetical protein